MLAFTYTLLQNVKRVEEKHRVYQEKLKIVFLLTVNQKTKK